MKWGRLGKLVCSTGRQPIVSNASSMSWREERRSLLVALMKTSGRRVVMGGAGEAATQCNRL